MSLAMESGRTGYGYGYVRLTWADFKSCCELHGFSPKPWQVHALRRMETIWLNHKNAKDGETPPDENQTMTPQLFLSMFGK